MKLFFSTLLLFLLLVTSYSHEDEDDYVADDQPSFLETKVRTQTYAYAQARAFDRMQAKKSQKKDPPGCVPFVKPTKDPWDNYKGPKEKLAWYENKRVKEDKWPQPFPKTKDDGKKDVFDSSKKRGQKLEWYENKPIKSEKWHGYMSPKEKPTCAPTPKPTASYYIKYVDDDRYTAAPTVAPKVKAKAKVSKPVKKVSITPTPTAPLDHIPSGRPMLVTVPAARACLEIMPSSGALQLNHCNRKLRAQQFFYTATTQQFHSVLDKTCLDMDPGTRSVVPWQCDSALQGQRFGWVTPRHALTVTVPSFATYPAVARCIGLTHTMGVPTLVAVDCHHATRIEFVVL